MSDLYDRIINDEIKMKVGFAGMQVSGSKLHSHANDTVRCCIDDIAHCDVYVMLRVFPTVLASPLQKAVIIFPLPGGRMVTRRAWWPPAPARAAAGWIPF